MQDVNNGGNWGRGQSERVDGNSVFSVQFFSKPKTVPPAKKSPLLFFFLAEENHTVFQHPSISVADSALVEKKKLIIVSMHNTNSVLRL